MILNLFAAWCVLCGIVGLIMAAFIFVLYLTQLYEEYSNRANWAPEMAVIKYENDLWEKKYDIRGRKKCETK